jgi:hypothetical protein
MAHSSCDVHVLYRVLPGELLLPLLLQQRAQCCLLLMQAAVFSCREQPFWVQLQGSNVWCVQVGG